MTGIVARLNMTDMILTLLASSASCLEANMLAILTTMTATGAENARKLIIRTSFANDILEVTPVSLISSIASAGQNISRPAHIR